MGGCAEKERFFLPGLFHPNSHPTTPFSLNKVQTDNRQIVLKPNNYLSSTNKIKFDSSLTRFSTKLQFQGTEVPERSIWEGNRSKVKLDKGDFVLKQTQSHYVEEQNQIDKQVKIDQESLILEQSIILDKKQCNFLGVFQPGENTKIELHAEFKNNNKYHTGNHL